MTAQERRLAQKARSSFNDFSAEWVAQGYEEADAGRAYNRYIDVDPDAIGDGSRSRNRRTGGGSNPNPDAPQRLNWITESLATQYKEYTSMDAREFQTMGSALEVFIDNEGKIRGIGEILKNIGGDIGMAIILNFKQQNHLLMEMGERVGLIGELSRDFRQEITDAYPDALRLGISFNELTESVTSLMEDSGKFRLLSAETIRDMSLASKFAKDMIEYAAMAADFEKVSLGVQDMTKATNLAGKQAMALGLNARGTVKDIRANLDLLNRYGFEKGVDGLSRMVQKSKEFRMNVTAATDFAEKVWSPEGALEVVANLQVLGGAVGDLNDPLKLMYMATNNVEGLQDAIIDASKALVTYNNEQGRFEVTGANLRRAKEMADELGMSMGELTQTAVASMERTQAASDLMAQGLNLNEDDREFLINMSQMKGGKMTIEIPKKMADQLGIEETSVALEDMSSTLAEELVARREELRDKTMQEIARDQVSMIENINRDVSFITSLMRTQAGQAATDLMRDLGWDPSQIGAEAYNLANKIGGKIDADVATDFIKNTDIYKNVKGKVNPVEANTPIQETTTQTTEEPKKTEPGRESFDVNINIRTNNAMKDDLHRSIMTDPWFQSQAKNSFLEMFKPQ